MHLNETIEQSLDLPVLKLNLHSSAFTERENFSRLSLFLFTLIISYVKTLIFLFLITISSSFFPLNIKCNEKGYNYKALLVHLVNYILELEFISKNHKITSGISKIKFSIGISLFTLNPLSMTLCPT